MAKTGFSEQELTGIIRAKEILQLLIKNSGIKQKEIALRITEQGLPLKQPTLANWLSVKMERVRPKIEYIQALVDLCCGERSLAQRAEIVEELHWLLGYTEGPLPPEQIHNLVHEKLNYDFDLVFNQQRDVMQSHLENLSQVLDLIEPLLLDYGMYHPMIYLESEQRSLVRQLLGENKADYKKYEVEDGYEIPLTQIQSVQAVSDIVNDLNASVRLMQRYVNQHLVEPGGFLLMDLSRLEEFIAYAWEISDRLLYHNQVIQAVPALKRSLLRMMTTCFGLRYILQNQNEESSEIAFQNVMLRKLEKCEGLDFDLHCSVAVFMGMLARQMMRSAVPTRIQRALKLYRKACQWLDEHHPQLSSEQEQFHYKKELANLHYDLANYALNVQAHIPEFQSYFHHAMQQAQHLYQEVLADNNIFVQGLSPARLQHLRIFSALATAWSSRGPRAAEKALEDLLIPETLDESYWTVYLAKAIGYGILAYQSEKPKSRTHYQDLAHEALKMAEHVDGFGARTRAEIENEFVLRELMLVSTL